MDKKCVMEKVIKMIFPEFNETVSVELDDSQSPKTVKAILENLPIEVNITKWGEENAKSEVNLFDVAFWPEGNAFCFFYGPTPISKAGKILPYSPVNIIGRIISTHDNVLNKVKDRAKVLIKKAAA